MQAGGDQEPNEPKPATQMPFGHRVCLVLFAIIVSTMLVMLLPGPIGVVMVIIAFIVPVAGACWIANSR